jgi:hypothetical protein
MFLARGVFAFPKFIDIGYDGGSPALDTWAQDNRIEGSLGVILLIAGFIGQFIGTMLQP